MGKPAIDYTRQNYSMEGYLALEAAATEKHQYYKGEISSMSGAKLPHNQISGNLYHQLRNKLKGTDCTPFNSDTRIHVPICGRPGVEDTSRITPDFNIELV